MNKLSKTLLGIVLLLGIALMSTAVNAVEFKDVTSARTSSGFVMAGALNFGDAPVEQLNVKLICNGVEKAAVINELDGTFRVSSLECYSNQEAYVQVALTDGQNVQSESVKVPRGKSVHAVNTARVSTASIATNPAGVPEFSLLTMGTAVVVVTLGLVFLRKN